MKLHELRVEGFGKLIDRTFEFHPHVNVIWGPNEGGKSTLSAALVAALFGVGRKEPREAWRPWSGTRYAAALRYSLDDGRSFEVQRDFSDPKSARVYDENGNDVSAEIGITPVESLVGVSGMNGTMQEIAMQAPYKEWVRVMEAGLAGRRAYP